MRLGGFSQRKFFADHRTQRSVFQTSHERGVDTRHLLRWRVREHHSAQVDITLHRIARIDLHHPAEAIGLVRVRARVEAMIGRLKAMESGA